MKAAKHTRKGFPLLLGIAGCRWVPTTRRSTRAESLLAQCCCVVPHSRAVQDCEQRSERAAGCMHDRPSGRQRMRRIPTQASSLLLRRGRELKKFVFHAALILHEELRCSPSE